MGKKKKASSGDGSLGRALIRDRAGTNKGKRMVSDNTMLHTTELQDGYDWARLNLQSVTEESSFQEFLATAQLAGTEFQAEKLNVRFVNAKSSPGLLTCDEISKAIDAQERCREALKIPRRPPWSADTTPSELDKNEKHHFLEWRSSLAQLEKTEGLVLTPFEKNIQFWRQLWRVVERSDVVVQIVDARNPLLFWCEDLGKYVKEISEHKMNLILINKADFLTEHQRECWAKYFSTVGVRVVFFSAHLASDSDKDASAVIESVAEEEAQDVKESKLNTSSEEKADLEEIHDTVTHLEAAVELNAGYLDRILNQIGDIIKKANLSEENKVENSSQVLTRSELIQLFKTIHEGPKVTKNVTTIGLVGYPNVGKSSTINALLSSKKVSVSATPGKTKHFQTLYLDRDLQLCDCPGLVMPSFVFTKAEMILNGILPIDQMRDHVPPTNLVASFIPRHVFEDKYGIMLPAPLEGEEPDRPPTAEELVNAYAYNRGFMTANGQPDGARAARRILKDYLQGKLLYCHAPPSVDQAEYYTWPERQKVHSNDRVVPPAAVRAIKPNRATAKDVDKAFFESGSKGVHAKGVVGGAPIAIQEGDGTSKPWKQQNKHKNKKKKEKLRRVYAHLDQH
ncbi:hypothetical protein NQ315_017092 [Exocentrus adspersus]|uniref:Large subunit GTPase 1 homolog n=1 Tax=Exocentrus adspersus TaxID=1586481 RepID=A0AAV8VI33_9CUCU|nr:hypothetical protein NQ315_017092 [Exocentrus adspersus]